MTFIEFLLEANMDDTGARVQGLGGSIAGNNPNVLPSGTFDEVKKKVKKNETSKSTTKRRNRN